MIHPATVKFFWQLVGTLLGLLPSLAFGRNFVVVTPTPNAERYVAAAESAYVAQAKFWFQKPHPQLAKPVTITVTIRPGGAGGATTFALSHGQAYGWRMRLEGPDEATIIRDVLPHEVCHVVMYAHFRRPLPRFFDEGAASLMEGEAERARHVSAVASTRPPPLRYAMDLKRYPRNPRMVGTFYNHAHVVTAYMVKTWGPDKFIAFLEDPRKPSEKLKPLYGLTPDELDAAALQRSAARPSKSRREVIVFSDPKCGPCRTFKRDSSKFTGYSFRIVNVGTAEWKTYSADFKAATGKPVDRVPIFWVAKSTTHTVGYNGPRSFLEWLISIPAGLFRLIVGDPQPSGGAAPATFQDGTQPVSADLFGRDDWSGVRVLVLAARQDVGAVRGQARSTLIGLSRGPLERKIAELTKGKARVFLVAERTEPKRYAAVMRALGREPAAFNVAVIVPSTNQGLIKGIILKKVEAIGERKLANAPVDVLFERIDAATVASVTSAMQVTDEPASVPLPKEGETPPQPGVPVETFKGELKSIVADAIKAHAPASPLPAAIQDAIADKAAERVVDKLPTDKIPNWLLAALFGTGGVGYTLRELVKSRFDKKQEAAKEKEIAVQEAKLSVLQSLASSLPNSSEPAPVQPAALSPSSSAPAQSSVSPAASEPANKPSATAAEPTPPMTAA